LKASLFVLFALAQVGSAFRVILFRVPKHLAGKFAAAFLLDAIQARLAIRSLFNMSLYVNLKRHAALVLAWPASALWHECDVKLWLRWLSPGALGALIWPKLRILSARVWNPFGHVYRPRRETAADSPALCRVRTEYAPPGHRESTGAHWPKSKKF
jgi:hypothetical protein